MKTSTHLAPSIAKSIPALAIAGLIVWTLLAAAPPASAFNPSVLKIYGRSTDPGSNYFGQTVALTDRFMVVGEPFNDDHVASGGAVHVFDTRTGRYLRTLKSEDVRNGDPGEFGIAVAACGRYAVIGAHVATGAAAGSGAAYLFDLQTGRELFKLTPMGGLTGDRFGGAVAIDGSRIVVGANQSDVAANLSGAAWLFDATTGTELARLAPSDAAASHRFGMAVAICGSRVLVTATGHSSLLGAAYLFDATQPGPTIAESNIMIGLTPGEFFGGTVGLSGSFAVVGAQNDDIAAPNAGALHVFDCDSGSWLHAIVAEDAQSSAALGASLSVSGSLVLAGAPLDQSNYGAAYLFDIAGRQLAKLVPTDRFDDSQVGRSAAICGNRALVGAVFDQDAGSNAGAAYFYQPLAGPLPLTSIAKAGDFAPGAIGATFRSFGPATINPDGAAVVTARLGGSGASRGRSSGLWSQVIDSFPVGPLHKIAVSRDPLNEVIPNIVAPEPFVRSLGTAFSNQTERLAFDLTAAGGDFNRHRILAIDKGSTKKMLAETSSTAFGINGNPIQTVPEFVQTHTALGGAALAFALKRGGAISAANDSGVALYDDSQNFVDAFSEGDLIPMGGGAQWGQFMPRLSQGGANDLVYSAYVIDGGTPFQRLFRDTNTVFSQGDALMGLGEVRGFLAEASTQPFGPAVTRMTLTGAGVNGSNNEAISSQAFGTVARKGDQVPGEASGVVWSRFLGFWPVSVDRVIFLAKLRGPGVSGRNDCALYLWQEDQSYLKLLREGDPICDCDCPSVGAIQRVDVNPVSGDYVVLTSVTGGDRKKNQALFAGDANAGDATTEKYQRVPHLRLRKGTLYAATGGAGTTGIRSMSLAPTTDQGGAGGKGLGQAINDQGEIAICIIFDDRAKEVLAGYPYPIHIQ
ncbi:MAG: hypothetical protein H7A53_00335 [Akkermansiaceae bacterium]|nr:hypothetical protein [Akkermansiaceae bacterium]